MTLEEAIKILSELHDQCCQADNIFCTDTTGARCEAVDMAISALQTQDVPDINVGDTISRQAAIEAVEHITSSMSVCVNTDECHGMKRMQRRAVIELTNLPSSQPETAKRIVGKSRDGMTLWYQCDMCNEPVDAQDDFCRGCGRRLIDE